MEKIDYVRKYVDAYHEMRTAAIEKMKNCGKTLEVYEVCKQRVKEFFEDYDDVEDADALDEYINSNTYACAFDGKYGEIRLGNIVMVRYNDQTNDVDVYLESEEGDIAEWFEASRIGYDSDAIYMTIHDFCD